MAVDTASKRGSVLGLGLAPLVVLPFPDTSVDQEDRLALAFAYSGTSFGAILTGVVPSWDEDDWTGRYAEITLPTGRTWIT